MYKLTLYCPVNRADTISSLLETEDYTCHFATGKWTDGEGEYIVEDVALLSFIVDDKETGEDLAREASKLLINAGESCVLYELDPCNAVFTYAKRD